MSRITARETTIPAPVDRPCSARKKTSCPIVCDSAHPAEASVNTAMPHKITGLPKAVCQRAVEQAHERKAEQVGGQRLLHFHRCGSQRRSDA